jgi:hypothetical protein
MTLDGSAVCHSTLTGPNLPNGWELYTRTVRAVSRHCGEQHHAGSVRSVSRCTRSRDAPLRNLSTIVDDCRHLCHCSL